MFARLTGMTSKVSVLRALEGKLGKKKNLTLLIIQMNCLSMEYKLHAHLRLQIIINHVELIANRYNAQKFILSYIYEWTRSHKWMYVKIVRMKDKSTREIRERTRATRLSSEPHTLFRCPFWYSIPRTQKDSQHLQVTLAFVICIMTFYFHSRKSMSTWHTSACMCL